MKYTIYLLSLLQKKKTNIRKLHVHLLEKKMLSLILSFDKKPTLSKKQENLTFFENIFTNQKHGNSKMFYLQILTNLETF